ncbi:MULTISPECIES: phosphoserine phosphatase SerB [Sphingobium]|jgi:phosphoserine phosphatase|uniref:phosphoserine phosphatase SerB n=1 Tax=Sphingobium TaxID=165695 RepID=UPI000C3ECAAC|nr:MULTISPECIES: phosphoserine phosphatase SerB [Sphingobium]MAP45853.1 phosphoserine phosphatase SerB [Sphingobium sp.]MBA37030.1 phosphoserine phosphatase SerB [Sphingobium sp.]MBS46255.1 phosphoserine phosphatase SerB [Sphingobium sp.]MCC4255197.1 phosphoserine phosphatase SerB [Sphingobium lactosutens]HCW60682.1 phosphoserine phosphatase SerB [Sphingobium sp.]|tara:strand:- start:3406 stop:4284 length:879 start_codon:yes stop_codon:yes gene_type:complete
MFVATLVASGSMGQGDIAEAADRLRDAGCAPSDCCWLDTDKAADLFFAADPAAARAALAGMGAHIDLIVQASETRAKALLIADMDSTMITVECIDELADYAGIKPQIADITERAMRGELDFAGALHERVALLKGLPDSAIDQCRVERVRVMPGAKALVRTMKARGARTLLVSGGFTRFTGPIAAEIGFDAHVANVLEIADGALLGTVETPIVDAARKRAELDAAIAQGVERALTLAVGDGANDIPMIQGAGLGVAYHAKPKTREAAAAEIVHGDLSVLLYAQGIASEHWVVA